MSIRDDALKYLREGGKSRPSVAKIYAESIYDTPEQVSEFIRTAFSLSAEQQSFKRDVDRIWPESKGY